MHLNERQWYLVANKQEEIEQLIEEITHGDPHCRLQGHGQRQACEIENHRHGDMKTEEGGSDAMYLLLALME